MDCSVTVLHCVVYMEEEKRMKLYFGNMVTAVTTLMIVSLVGFVGYSISNRSNINFWGGQKELVCFDIWSCYMLLCSRKRRTG